MDAKTAQKQRLAELVIQRGFATASAVNTHTGVITFRFTPDGLKLAELLKKLLDVDHTRLSQDEFNDLILFFPFFTERV